MCGFIGIHTMPPDHALVPPTLSAFSNSPTLAPSSCARIAAVECRRTGAEDDDVEGLHSKPLPT